MLSNTGNGVTIIFSFNKRAKNENNLRSRLKKSLKNHSVTEDDQVKFMMPKIDMETDEDILNRLVGLLGHSCKLDYCFVQEGEKLFQSKFHFPFPLFAASLLFLLLCHRYLK